MATHDYSIANQSFPATRSDINNALAAIQSSNSAATAPSGTGSTVAGELFYNTTANKLQIATDANGTFVDVALDSSGNLAVTGTLGVTGAATFTAEATFNGGIAFGDSDKATFGAGDDLQIYHDGSHSYIKDAGTGDLIIGADSFYVNNAAFTENKISAVSNGAVTLYYDNVEKLATTSTGVTVTGDVTSSTGKFLRGSADYIQVNASNIDFVVDASTRVRIENDGDLHADGDVIAYSTTISDERLKTGIHTIQDALDKVYSLKGVEFTYKADGKRSAGLIAQDVEKVLPSAVSEKELPLKVDDGNLYKTLQYDQTIGLLVEAVKELKDLVDEQAQEIELLKKG